MIDTDKMTEAEAQAELAVVAGIIGDKLSEDECLLIARLFDVQQEAIEREHKRADEAERLVAELRGAP